MGSSLRVLEMSQLGVLPSPPFTASVCPLGWGMLFKIHWVSGLSPAHALF